MRFIFLLLMFTIIFSFTEEKPNSSPPEISCVYLLGLPMQGYTIQPFWRYNDPENTNEDPGSYQFRFQRTDDPQGNRVHTLVDASPLLAYTLTASDMGKWVRVAVRCRNLKGLQSEWTYSKWEFTSTTTQGNQFQNFTLTDLNMETEYGSDGIAEELHLMGAEINKVGEGKGHQGKYQSVQSTNSGGELLISPCLGEANYVAGYRKKILKPGYVYTVSFQYRSSDNLLIRTNGGLWREGSKTFPAYSGTTDLPKAMHTFTQSNSEGHLEILIPQKKKDDYIEISDLKLTVTKTVFQTINPFGNEIPFWKKPVYTKTTRKSKKAIYIDGKVPLGHPHHWKQYEDPGFIFVENGHLIIQNCSFDKIQNSFSDAVIDVRDWFDKDVIVRNCRGNNPPLTGKARNNEKGPAPLNFIQIRCDSPNKHMSYEVYDNECEGYNVFLISPFMNDSQKDNIIAQNLIKNCGYLRYEGPIAMDGFHIKVQQSANTRLWVDRNVLISDLSKCYPSDRITVFNSWGNGSAVQGIRITRNYFIDYQLSLENELNRTAVGINAGDAYPEGEYSGNIFVAGNVMCNVAQTSLSCGFSQTPTEFSYPDSKGRPFKIPVSNHGVKLYNNIVWGNGGQKWQRGGITVAKIGKTYLFGAGVQLQGNKARYVGQNGGERGFGIFESDLPEKVFPEKIPENFWGYRLYSAEDFPQK